MSVSRGRARSFRGSDASVELREEFLADSTASPGRGAQRTVRRIHAGRAFMLTARHAGPDDAFRVPQTREFAHLRFGTTRIYGP